jgi:hypothetical protein
MVQLDFTHFKGHLSTAIFPLLSLPFWLFCPFWTLFCLIGDVEANGRQLELCRQRPLKVLAERLLLRNCIWLGFTAVFLINVTYVLACGLIHYDDTRVPT